MHTWTAQMENPQRIVIFKRPYRRETTTRTHVEGFALHPSAELPNLSKELAQEIGDGAVVSHSHAVHDGVEIFTFVVTDEE
jgi:translation initiation factor 1 (eIF-1/SUI1)